MGLRNASPVGRGGGEADGEGSTVRKEPSHPLSRELSQRESLWTRSCIFRGMGFARCPRCLQRCNTNAKLAIKENDKYNFVRRDMFDITVNDVLNVYKQLKDSYPLVLTTTSALNAELDAGFTIDCPIIVAKAHGQIIWLYECDDMFVMDVMDEEQTKGTHWHPYNVECAAHDIEDFINGKSNYDLQPFRQA